MGNPYSMFAPDPPRIDQWLEAIVIYPEEQKSWQFPRVETMGSLAAYEKFRYRKFLLTHLLRSPNLWPDFARYVAELNTSAGHRPLHIVLVRYWQDIPPPELDKKAAVNLPRHQEVFYDYNCDDEK